MDLLYLLLLLIHFVVVVGGEEETVEEAKTFLKYHGYYLIQDNEADIDNLGTLEVAISEFQATYGLEINGVLTNETISFMRSFWCGTSDNFFSLKNPTTLYKWGTNSLTWNIITPAGTRNLRNKYQIVANRAFKMWSEHTNLIFRYSPYQPNIIISLTDANHTCYISKKACLNLLGGGVLGHAYYPYPSSTSIEIHIYQSIKWYFENGIPPDGEHSLLFTLTHEIGHALGIAHSSVPNAVMYPFYQVRNHTTELDRDDIAAIEQLYGSKNQGTTPTVLRPTTAAEKPTITPEEKQPPNAIVKPSLCDLNSKTLKSFLVVNNKLFIFYEKYVWMLNLSTKEIQNEPLLITDWLRFLPISFTNISAIYQRPNNEIVLFKDSGMYIFEYETFNLRRKEFLHHIFHPSSTPLHIQGAVNSNRGKTYWFFNNNMFIELDECKFRPIRTGLITEHFTGVPSIIHSVFRYTNGLLYFIYNEYYYEFNEFTNTMTKSGKFDLDFFGISCPNTSLLEQLKLVLSKIIAMKSVA